MLKIWLEFSDVQVSVSNFCEIRNFRGNDTTVSETSAIKYIFLDALHKCHWNQHTRTNYRKSYSWLEPHTRSTEGFNGFLETREIEVSERQPEVKHNDNPLRPPFTTKNMVGSLRRLASNGFIFKVSSRVKNHHLPNFQAHQELSFKKNSRKKCFFLCKLMERKSFFYANYFDWSLTSPVILDTHAAVEPS